MLSSLKKVLVLTAHPDDLEVGCGGTVARLIEAGAQVKNLILVGPGKEVNPHRNQNIVTEELNHSAQVLGFHFQTLTLPTHENGRPHLDLTNNLITQIENLAPENYDLLITHWKEDWHQEHRMTHEAALAAFRNRARTIWFMEQFPYCSRYSGFCANVSVDISNTWKQKSEAIRCYSSYFDEFFLTKLQAFHCYRGFSLKVPMAETFHQFHCEL